MSNTNDKRSEKATRIIEARDEQTLQLKREWDGTPEHLEQLAQQLPDKAPKRDAGSPPEVNDVEVVTAIENAPAEAGAVSIEEAKKAMQAEAQEQGVEATTPPARPAFGRPTA